MPDGLGPDAFASLNGTNWEKWGKSTGELISKLYTDDKLDAAGQHALLKELHRKVETMERALADPRFASVHSALIGIRGALLRRLDIVQAILNTLELKPEDVKAARIKHARAHVLSAVGALESDLNGVPGGAAWLPYIRAAELRTSLKAGTSDGAVSAVEQKLNAAGSLKDKAQRDFLSRPAFARLAKSIAALRQAEQSNVTAGDVEGSRSKFADLEKSIEAYEQDGMTSDAQKLHTSLAAAEGAAIDGGMRIGRAVRKHYLNYNLQVIASEAFLTRLMSDQRVENGPVRDFVLGADVYGNQSTATTLTVDLKPGEDTANIDLVLNGVTNSSTAGYTDQATVYTSGYHQFGAVKELRFDGHRVATVPARMAYVQPSNTTTGAQTQVGWVPLFGAIANGIAVREAERKRPESEAIAAQRVESRVLPEFEQKTEQAIRDVNTRFQNDLKKRFEKAGVYPANVHASSNESYLRLSSQIVGPNQLAGDISNGQGDTDAGLVLHLHETLLNNAASHVNLAGQTLNDDQIKAELERYFSLLAGRPVKFKGQAKNAQATDDKNSVLIFDKNDPIRFTIEDGNVNIVLRAGFRQEGKEEIPTQVVTVPLHLAIKGNRLAIERGAIEVAPAGPSDDRAKQIVRAGVMRKKLESVIEPTTQERVFHIARTGRPDLDVTIASIRARNGWLTIWAN